MKLLHGDAEEVLRTLPAGAARCCVTSPPYYGLRDYGAAGQIGLEQSPDEYVARLVSVFAEVRRVLADDGTLWLVIGDSYAGSWGAQGRQGGGYLTGRSACSARQIAAAAKRERGTGSLAARSGLKSKDLIGIPWMVAFALRADGWWLRSEIVWHKRNCMPESTKDRPVRAHETVFLLAKSRRYFYDHAAVREPALGIKPGNRRPMREPPGFRSGPNHNTRGRLHLIGATKDRSMRDVVVTTTTPYKGAHFATYPPALVRPFVLAGSELGDVVLDPFNGAGTTGLVAQQLGRDYIGIDINAEYLGMTRARLSNVQRELPLRGGNG